MTSPAVAGGTLGVRKKRTTTAPAPGGLLVCGRVGIVEDVELKDENATGSSGHVLIAQINLNVHICNQMSFTVAVWRVRPLFKPVVKEEKN